MKGEREVDGIIQSHAERRTPHYWLWVLRREHPLLGAGVLEGVCWGWFSSVGGTANSQTTATGKNHRSWAEEVGGCDHHRDCKQRKGASFLFFSQPLSLRAHYWRLTEATGKAELGVMQSQPQHHKVSCESLELRHRNLVAGKATQWKPHYGHGNEPSS